MKLKVLQEELYKALSISSRFSSSKVQLPVLANILLSIKKNKFKISATNLETSVCMTIGAKTEKDGEITVPSKTITDLVGNLGVGQVSLDSEKEQLTIKASNFSSILAGMNASDFPQIPQSLPKKSVNLPAKDLVNMLDHVLFSVSTDETRPALTGVLIILKKSEIVFVSTDGFRLSQKKMSLKSSKNISEQKIIIPKNVLGELVRLTQDEDNIDFVINKEDNQVVFGIGSIILSSRIIEGSFPDFEKIIPKAYKYKVSIDKEDLLRAVKLASVFAREAANVIKMNVGKDFVEITAESSQSGSQKTKIEAKIDSEESGKIDLKIAFNYRFLEEFINVVEGDDIEMQFSDSNSPGVFLDVKDKNFLHIIMPVRIQE